MKQQTQTILEVLLERWRRTIPGELEVFLQEANVSDPIGMNQNDLCMLAIHATNRRKWIMRTYKAEPGDYVTGVEANNMYRHTTTSHRHRSVAYIASYLKAVTIEKGIMAEQRWKMANGKEIKVLGLAKRCGQEKAKAMGLKRDPNSTASKFLEQFNFVLYKPHLVEGLYYSASYSSVGEIAVVKEYSRDQPSPDVRMAMTLGEFHGWHDQSADWEPSKRLRRWGINSYGIE